MSVLASREVRVPRVTPMTWTEDKALRFTSEMLKRKHLLDDHTRRDPMGALALLLSRPDVQFYDVNGYGVIWFDPVLPDRLACVHALLWDKRAMGKPVIGLLAAADVCRKFNLRRLQAFIPATNRLACRFAERAGMQLEGVLREAVVMNGEPVDMNAYGALWHEFEPMVLAAEGAYGDDR